MGDSDPAIPMSHDRHPSASPAVAAVAITLIPDAVIRRGRFRAHAGKNDFSIFSPGVSNGTGNRS
jgi:hypothetical protein